MKTISGMALIAMVVILDQLTKWGATSSLILYHPKVILSFFNLTLAHNKGAAFSFLNSAGHWQNAFFIIVTCFVSTGLLFWYKKLSREDRVERVALCLIIGGAWGNLIDRFHYGYVIDFLEFHLGSYYWPIFNIADSAVCLGAVLLLFTTLRHKKG